MTQLFNFPQTGQNSKILLASNNILNIWYYFLNTSNTNLTLIYYSQYAAHYTNSGAGETEAIR